MKGNAKIKSILVVGALLITMLVAGIFLLIPKTYSADADANITATGEGVTIYVNGKDVMKTANGNNGKGGWYSPAGSKITIAVINENEIFESMTINGIEYTTPGTSDYIMPESGNIEITVTTRQPTAEDKGTYFGNPYLISNGETVSALSRILDGKGTDADFARFNMEKSAASIVALRHAYYRLTNNILVSSEHFTGLGTPAYPFNGCFDFNGFNASLKIVKTSIADSDYQHLGKSTKDGTPAGGLMVSYGFFSYIYGDGSPCLIRNADVRGSIAVNLTDRTTRESGRSIMIGGIAGVIGQSVQLDNIYSEVSVSVRANEETLYLGGLFGFCSSSISSWCEASYGGSFSNISGITYDSASAFVGGFVGALQNAYVNNFSVVADQCTIIANALSGPKGAAIAGGFAGVVYMQTSDIDIIHEVRDLLITNVTINVNNKVEIVSVIDTSETNNVVNPDDMKNQSFAISSGFIGSIYCDDYDDNDATVKFTLGRISFVNNVSRASENDVINITAQTNDADSYGAAFAGGLIGYARENAMKKISVNLDRMFVENVTREAYTLFNCSAEISAIQNGVGPAYAGGFFGYKAFRVADFSGTLEFNLCANSYRIDCIARQSPSSRIGVNKAPYECLAGFYTSKLPYGYTFRNCKFYVPRGKVSAERNVGSTAIGEIAAGGFAGIVSGGNSRDCFGWYQNSETECTLSNLMLDFTPNVEISACCYSYKSSLKNIVQVDQYGNPILDGAGNEIIDQTKYDKYKYNNNVYSGGFAGLVADYKSINDITVDFGGESGSAEPDATYSVYGVQNGVSGNDDLVTEGYVGGVFGLVLDTPCSNIVINGEDKLKSRVYFESTASPNTASVGGIIGAAWSLYKNETILKDAITSNMRVIGKAYSDIDSINSQPFDMYVGGAVGVAGTRNWGGTVRLTE